MYLKRFEQSNGLDAALYKNIAFFTSNIIIIVNNQFEPKLLY